MTLDQLRYFVAAAKYEHVGKAASSIAISPSVISTAIKALEEEFRCQLFIREKKKIRITIEGLRLKELGQKLLDQAAQMSTSLNQKPTQLHGHYRIGASIFLASRIVAPVWTEMQRKSPSLTADIRSLPTWSILDELLAGKMDFGLGYNPVPHPEIYSEVLHRGHCQVVVRKNHPILKHPRKKAYQYLHNYPCITHVASEKIVAPLLDPILKESNIVSNVSLFFDDDFVALENLKRSNNWSHMIGLYAAEFKDDLEVIPIPNNSESRYTIELFRHKSFEPRPVLNEFFSNIKQQLQKTTGGDEKT